MSGEIKIEAIPFTQYIRPDGRPAAVRIHRPENIAAKAREIIEAGFKFECELLTTGEVSLTISTDDEDVAIIVVPNGPEVPEAVDRLITEFKIENWAECMDCGQPLGKPHDIDCPGAESDEQIVLERHCAIDDPIDYSVGRV